MNKQELLPLPQLFLMHYAGGNTYSFGFLKKQLEPFFEVIALELPGRGKRMAEPLIKDQKVAVEDQLREFNKFRKLNVPFAVYGHSMGAILGFELIKMVEQKNDPVSCLIVTGSPGPGIKKEEPRYHLPKNKFIDALKELGGIPDEIYKSDELFDFFEPILRADFEIVEHEYEINPEEKVNCPIYCAMGLEEEFIEFRDNWKNYTRSNFESEQFPGNHFFINNHTEKLVSLIKKAYDGSLVY